MSRSKREIDEWIDQLVADDRGDAGGDPVRELVVKLRAQAELDSADQAELCGLLGAEAMIVAENVSAERGLRRTARPLNPNWRRRAMIQTFLSTLLGKLVVGTAALAVATTGMAATGTLPDPAQQWASDAVSGVGIEIPAPGDADTAGEHESIEMPEAPVLPDDASDTADAVTDTVFGGDPGTGAEFGASVAATASAGASNAGELPVELPEQVGGGGGGLGSEGVIPVLPDESGVADDYRR
jgi:hypothetical protein